MDNKLLESLPTVTVDKPVFGRITRIDNLGQWKFMVMPLQMTTSVRASYRGSGGIGVIQSQQFQNYSEELRIPSINFSTKYARRDLGSYVDTFKELVKPVEGLFSPPVVAFSWGQQVFSPCVITDSSVIETDWFGNGVLAACTMSITLLKVPQGQVVTV